MQRVVSRSELEAEGSSRQSSPEESLGENGRALQDFEFIEQPTQSTAYAPPGQQPEEGDGEDELAFNLFAPSGSNEPAKSEQSAVQRIRIRSPSLDPDLPAGFVRPSRDPSYYFTDVKDLQAKDDFSSSAVTGDQILAQSKSTWPGSTCNWRVLQIPPPSSSQTKSIIASAPSLFGRLIDTKSLTGGKRTRPGKKYRIRIRMKRAAVVKKREAIKAAEEAKEAEYREKKTRRNREKKVKKRARDKAKKVAEKDEAGEGDVDGGVSGSDSGDGSGGTD